MKPLAILRNAAMLCALPVLAGCGDNGIADVKTWMEQVRRETRSIVPKLPPPKQFTPFVYNAKDMMDPFNPGKLMTALANAQKRSGNALVPDPDRPREPLEAYPLDTLKMVGTLQKAGLSYALLQADKTIFRVKVGNYVGQNLGVVTSISEAAVELREVVQDAAGDWVERKAKLELQETKK